MNAPVRALYKIDARPDGPAQARQIVVRECTRRVSKRTLCAVSDLAGGVGRRDDRLSGAARNQRGAGRPAGLRLVNRLANRWGSHRTRTGGTRVWCESTVA